MIKKVISALLILSIVLLSGCVQIDVHQKIKRNGNVDISLTFKAESHMILNLLKQDLEIDPSVQNKYTYEETDNSVTYKFIDIDPNKDVIFKENENSYTDNSILNKDNYKKEFKFPYYYYTYEIDMTKENIEEVKPQNDEESLFDEFEMDSMFGEMFKIGYTVEVFGKIVETNGNKMDDNKVKFNIGTNDDKVYYVKFKDFFLSNWFGRIF
ncbi:unnamed protein product [marine sediment metagenome]|uniref:Lipoprotein n=1 Tax=marine sediment metagenome TaxID=412755 RepID=X1H627_9ZZZZ